MVVPLCVSPRPSPVPCRAKGGWLKPGAGCHESSEAQKLGTDEKERRTPLQAARPLGVTGGAEDRLTRARGR